MNQTITRTRGSLVVTVQLNGAARCETAVKRVRDGEEKTLAFDSLNPVLQRERKRFVEFVSPIEDRLKVFDLLTEIGEEVASLRQAGGKSTAEESPAEEAIEGLNERYAVILGGSGGILRQSTRDDGHRGFDVISPAQLRVNEMPRQVLVAGREKPVAEIWLKSTSRREYEGICFRPSNDAPQGYFNLWEGFAVSPSAEGSCQRFIDHVSDNVCGEDESLFAWVMGWFAQIVQQPHRKTGTALALIGPQGAGKTIVGQSVGALLGRHYLLVADPRFIVGRFNSHVVAALLLQADEGFWGGDHAVDGKLKDIITGAKHQVEYKGREPYTVDNHVRLLVTSNQQRVIPAAFDQRRFAVCEVSPRRANDHAYFAALRSELENGGSEALLHYLLTYDLSDINLRLPPKTEALLRQKTQSATPEEAWWLDVLQEGVLPGKIESDKGIFASCKGMYGRYLEAMQQRKASRPVASETFGHFLRKVVPTVERIRPTVYRDVLPERVWCYVLPPLLGCRNAFDQFAGQAYDWPVDLAGDGTTTEAEWE